MENVPKASKIDETSLEGHDESFEHKTKKIVQSQSAIFNWGRVPTSVNWKREILNYSANTCQ